MASIPTDPPGSLPASPPKSGAGSFRSSVSRPPAACRSWPGRPRPTSARPCGLRELCPLWRPGRGHRLALLLPALPRIGVRLFPRDRLELPHRRDALQHSHVRQPHRRAHDHAAGGVRADHRHQGLVGRHGLHDADDVRRAAHPRPDFVFLTGWEAVLVPMLMVGCNGGTNATSGIVPELTRQVYDLTRAGQLDQAMQLQFRLLELFDAMLYSADFPEGFRAAIELRGFNFGKSRQPLSETTNRPGGAAARAAMHFGGFRCGGTTRGWLCGAHGKYDPRQSRSNRPGSCREIARTGGHLNEASGTMRFDARGLFAGHSGF